MIRYGHLSVAQKIRWMIMSTTTVALLLASIVFVSVEVMISRKALVERVSVLAEFVSTHVTAALTFDDADTATDMLQSMISDRDISQARIFDSSGELFASFHPVGRPAAVIEQSTLQALTTGTTAHQFNQNTLHLVAPIDLDGEQIGLLYIQVSLNNMTQQIVTYLMGILTILTGVLALVYCLSFVLHRRISGPIEQLLRGMKRISREQNYALRIEQGDHDEIGAIISGFNKMIEQIERRNKQLEQKKYEVEQHAFYDALTGLPNRRLLMKRLSDEVALSQQNGSIGALMYMDLDHFKTINDSLGHSTGDKLLINVANRLGRKLSKTDISARVGGDEFIIILTNLSTHREKAVENALSVAETIRDTISRPYQIDERVLHTSPSIGITLFDAKNNCTSNIIKQADLAMYRAKEDGRNLVQFFSDDMQMVATQRQEIEEDLRFALEKAPHQLELYYQPQVDRNGVIFGAEVLLRWHHPQHGFVSPATFIPVAETTGLIHMLGRRVLSEACRQLAHWQSKGLQLQLAVNISPNEFLHTDFTENVLAIVKRTGVDPSQLELEITEGVLLRSIEDTVRVMLKLKETGIQFSIDDFGTGYSSLQYLKKLPLEKLKIDQSFVRDITTDPNDAAIVTTIIAMTKHLGLNVIAEGVETKDEYQFLSQQGCEAFQGYYFDRPLTLNDFETRLSKTPALQQPETSE
mgnify:CR=1 FL=1